MGIKEDYYIGLEWKNKEKKGVFSTSVFAMEMCGYALCEWKEVDYSYL